MHIRVAPALAVALAISASACGTEAAAAPEGARMARYAYQPGDSLDYQVDLGMSMVMEATADPSLGGAMDTAMDMSATAGIGYTFAEGPQPDTVEVTITTTILDGGATMTQFGRTEVIPLDQIAGNVAGTVVLLLDAQGGVVSVEIDGMPLPAELLDGGLAGQATSQPQHIGPQFPDGPIGVGSTWATEQTVSAYGLVITQRGEHAVLAEETIDGRSTWKIESVITTGAAEVDLVEMMREMMGSEAASAPGVDAASVKATLELFESLDADMDMRIDEARTDMTVWFDPVAGIVVRAVVGSTMSVEMAMGGIPGSDDMEVSMDMALSQTMNLAD